MNDEFENVIERMVELCNSFISESVKVKDKKSANKRARKLSNELGKLGVSFRKESVLFDKNKKLREYNSTRRGLTIS